MGKDLWDKIEVVGKIAVPVLVAITVLYWNGQKTARDTASAMTQVAVGILQAERPVDGSDSALRNWAISVLERPSDPPPLSPEAATELRKRSLPSVIPWSMVFSDSSSRRALEEFLNKSTGEGNVELAPEQ